MKRIHLGRFFVFSILVLVSIGQTVVTAQNSGSESSFVPLGTRWFKGNLHTHSFWSDGNDFPEMIAARYKDNGYDFLSLTDHNVLSRGERWMSEKEITKRGGDTVIPKYLKKYGRDWVKTRGDKRTGTREFLLRPLGSYRSDLQKDGTFLMIEGEEISDSFARRPIHMNATGVSTLLRPAGGGSVVETIRNNLRNVEIEAKRSGKQVLVHLNHPNFGWAISAEQLAMVTEEKFFEVFNGHPSIRHLGGSKSPSIEKMWDIINTIRLDKLSADPIFGMGTDDSHNYHGQPGKDSRPLRGWVMVRCRNLEASALIGAMKRGDFYSSSGVTLTDVSFDKTSGRLELKIQAEPAVQYKTQFIGTMKNYDQNKTPIKGKEDYLKGRFRYSKDVGKVLAETTDFNPTYTLTGKELYVRAVVTSTKKHPSPSFKKQFTQAWTQPVGWRK